MAAKQLVFREDARDKIRRGAQALALVVKVTRLALQNAGSIASLILTIDCMIANAPQPKSQGAPGAGAIGQQY